MTTTAVLVPAILTSFALPIFLALALRRRFRVPWLFFCVGMLTFAAAWVVRLPLVELLNITGAVPTDPSADTNPVSLAIILGLSAALAEEIARAAGFRLLGAARRFEDGLMMGLGHGALQAMLAGGVLLAFQASALSILRDTGSPPQTFPSQNPFLLREQLRLLSESQAMAFLPLWERVLTLLAQIILSLLVLESFTSKNPLPFIAALVYQTGFYSISILALLEADNSVLLQGLLALMLLPGVIWLASRWQSSKKAGTSHPPSWLAEARLFKVALIKELLQQWRTKRVLVVVAILTLFGMISPLLARFMPQLLSGLEGAEQFAELIPDPTIGDAVNQYLRNLTQFGFIIVILLGMAAVSGEKEKGTAAILLSKPLPRWSFVLSKFWSQMIVYGAGLLLAAGAAYVYTMVLFSRPDPLAFAAANALLLLWLAIFVAITLLGSVLGRTAGTSAGIAVAGSAILLLAGNTPRYGSLAPSGLVNWASQLMLAQNVPPNGGAMVMAVVAISVMLITAIAVFDQQEL